VDEVVKEILDTNDFTNSSKIFTKRLQKRSNNLQQTPETEKHQSFELKTRIKTTINFVVAIFYYLEILCHFREVPSAGSVIV
jgi:hypothetical protein